MHHPLKAELPRRMNRVHVDGNHVLGRKAAFEQQLGQGVFDALLYGTFEWPRAKHRVEANLGQLGQRGW